MRTASKPHAERLWSKRELAEYFGVTVRAVERMSIPRVTLPGRGRRPIVRYDPVQVRAWVEARRSRPSGLSPLQQVG